MHFIPSTASAGNITTLMQIVARNGVGAEGSILSYPDAVTWSAVESGVTKTLNGVAASADSDAIFYTDDLDT